MNKNISILDCTLRDGGLVDGVKGHFGHGVINSIYKRLEVSGIDIIEIGFMDDTKKFNMDNVEVPRSEDFSRLITPDPNRKSMIVGMVMLPVVTENMINNIGPKSESIIDGIRVVFQKPQLEFAYNFCKQIKERGYKLFIQPAMLNKYSFEEAATMVRKMNELKPHAIYMVDTYGLMHKQDLFNYFDVFEKNSDKDVAIGYHSHNNFQLGYSNSIELMQYCKQRPIIIDSSVYGMGKRSGNCHTELLASYLNHNYGRNFDIGQILEIIDLEILKLHEKYKWGYSLVDFIAASSDRYYGYIEYLLKKKTLSIAQIQELILRVPEEKKTEFHKDIIDDILQEYQSIVVNDDSTYAMLKSEISGKEIMILSPGPSLTTQSAKIKEHIKKHKPIVFAINVVPADITANYIFLSNARRYNHLLYDIIQDDKTKLLVTSNITAADNHAKRVFDFSKLRIDVQDISDNATLLLLGILGKIGIKQATVAGFDGFSSGVNNYSSDYTALCTIGDTEAHNKKIVDYLKTCPVKLEFITESKYS